MKFQRCGNELIALSRHKILLLIPIVQSNTHEDGDMSGNKSNKILLFLEFVNKNWAFRISKWLPCSDTNWYKKNSLSVTLYIFFWIKLHKHGRCINVCHTFQYIQLPFGSKSFSLRKYFLTSSIFGNFPGFLFELFQKSLAPLKLAGTLPCCLKTTEIGIMLAG